MFIKYTATEKLPKPSEETAITEKLEVKEKIASRSHKSQALGVFRMTDSEARLTCLLHRVVSAGQEDSRAFLS